MIHATLRDTGLGASRALTLRTEGHGKTDVCNAVSMLAQTGAAYLDKLETEYPNGLVVQCHIGEGLLEVKAFMTDYWDAGLHTRLSALHEILELGLLQLASQAPSEMHFSAPV
jgi:uncharacterized protein YsxB (DUF464 family)